MRVAFTVLQEAPTWKVRRFKVHALSCKECSGAFDEAKVVDRTIPVCEVGASILIVGVKAKEKS